jgi:uncharacterized protein (DUF1015 family)
VQSALAARVAPPPLYIADGHHRYETSVAYADQLGRLGSDAPEAFLLATILSSADPGVALLPTHRLVKNVPADRLTSLFRHLGELFDVHEVDLADLEGRLRHPLPGQPTFGIALASGTVYQVCVRDRPTVEAALPDGLAPSLRHLDVTLAQHLILDRTLGLPASETATTDRLAYTRDAREAVKRVHDGEFDAAVLLGNTPARLFSTCPTRTRSCRKKARFFIPNSCPASFCARWKNRFSCPLTSPRCPPSTRTKR